MKQKVKAFVCIGALLLACTMQNTSVFRAEAAGPSAFEALGTGDLENSSSESSGQTSDSSGQTGGSSSGSSAPDQNNQEQLGKIEDLSQQINQLKNQQAELQNKINAAKTEKEQKELEKKNIDGQLYNTAQTIQLTEQKIALLEAQIQETDLNMDALQLHIQLQYENFKSRLRSAYMAKDYSMIEYLFGAGSFVDFSVRMETVTRISALDSQIIADLEDQIATLDLLQHNLELDKQDLQSTKEELEGLKNQLNAQSLNAQKYISDIDAMEKEFLANTAQLQQMQKKIQAEIDEIYRSLTSIGEYKGDGTWAWPVPGYSFVSSPYGSRFQGTDFHTGMDISGSGKTINGAPFVSSGAGTVVKVQNNGSSGFGLFCIVDHGGGYTTLYAHCKSIIVSVGDEVEKGQVIGYVGNSGWVIPAPSASNPNGGSHLHFEIRINGVHKNPANYLY